MFLQKEEPIIDRRLALAGVPVLNDGISIEPSEAGKTLVTVRTPRGNGWLARFQPPVLERKVRLDDLGGFVLGLVDGRRDVISIINLFEKKFRTNRRETELSVVAFLKSLVQRNVVSIAIPKNGAGS
jgi:hypothetical protein